jgi:hypothetical protein
MLTSWYTISVMSAEKPVIGQVVSHPFGAAMIFERRGCGSSPNKCGISLTRAGVIGNITYCLLVNPPSGYQSTIDLESGKKKWEMVDTVSCNSEPPITPVSS